MIVTLADPYLAQNALRAYPFADDSQPPDNTSVVDFRATVFGLPAGVIPRATLTEISTETVGTTTVCRLTVTVVNGKTVSGVTPVETLRFDIPTTLAAASPFTAPATATTAVGELTVFSSILNWRRQTYTLPFAVTTVAADTLRVDSLQSAESKGDAADGISVADATKLLTGEIVLDPGRNTDPYIDGHHIRLDITKGGGIGEHCQTIATSQNCSNVLFTVNGERPGSDGELKLVGTDGITVTPLPSENALLITLDAGTGETLAKTCEPSC